MDVLNNDFEIIVDEDLIDDFDDEKIYSDVLYKEKYSIYRNKNSRIWWVENDDVLGTYIITFNLKDFYHIFSDDKYKMSKEEIEILKEDDPYWYHYLFKGGFPKYDK